MTKLEIWQKSLKIGDPIRVLYNHFEIIGIFLNWKYYGAIGAEYVALPWWYTNSDAEVVIDRAKSRDFKSFRDRILAGGDTRIRPVDYSILEDYQIECLTIIKNRLDEYQNN
jgi:hypothetical protein